MATEAASKAATWFRVVAFAEALSWTGLLIGMFLKYVAHSGDGGVPVLGMVHGVLFVLYVLSTIVVARVLRWRAGTVAVGLLASIPPLFTWLFESWALRTGKLDGPARRISGGTNLFVREPEAAAA